MKNQNQSLASGLKTAGVYVYLFIVLAAVLRLKGKSVSQIVTLMRRVKNKMDGNPNFPDPAVSMADWETATDALDAAEAAMDGSHEKTIARDARLSEAHELMSIQVSYVNTKSRGDLEIAASSGFDVREPRNPVGLLTFPRDFRAVNTPVAGQLLLNWKGVKKRTSYSIQCSGDGTEANILWTREVTQLHLMLNDLPSDERLYFRIATISTAGNGGYSPWISCRPN